MKHSAKFHCEELYMSKIKEFIADNPVVVGTGVIMLMMSFMDFEKQGTST
jgi:hypothetical protein